jgi:acyl carrier protein
MDDTQNRLARCFLAAIPSLTETTATSAEANNTEGWDSVASVTLLAAVEEEFGIEIALEDATRLLSFAGLLRYLQEQVVLPQ